MNSRPTIGQIEREISQRVQALYNSHIGQRPQPVICHTFDTEIVITLEKSVTQTEQTLLINGYANLAEEVQAALHQIIKPQIKDLVEQVTQRRVLDVVSNTSFTIGRTSIVIFLEQLPEVRNPQVIPKAN